MNKMSFDRIIAMKNKIYFKTLGIIFEGTRKLMEISIRGRVDLYCITYRTIIQQNTYESS